MLKQEITSPNHEEPLNLTSEHHYMFCGTPVEEH